MQLLILLFIFSMLSVILLASFSLLTVNMSVASLLNKSSKCNSEKSIISLDASKLILFSSAVKYSVIDSILS